MIERNRYVLSVSSGPYEHGVELSLSDEEARTLAVAADIYNQDAADDPTVPSLGISPIHEGAPV